MQKCDEQVPTCQNCIKRGVQCKYRTALSPRIGQDIRTIVRTDWFPNVDSTLFNYFVAVVLETMVPVSSWAAAAQEVVSIAIEVRP